MATLVDQDIQYVLYSSKLGVVFKLVNGRYIVDRTYKYDTCDDLEKLINVNNKYDSKITSDILSQWNSIQSTKKAESVRKFLQYDGEFKWCAGINAQASKSEEHSVSAVPMDSSTSQFPMAVAQAVSAPVVTSSSSRVSDTNLR